MAAEPERPELLVGHVAALAERFRRLTAAFAEAPPARPLERMLETLATWLDEDVAPPRWACWWGVPGSNPRVMDAWFAGWTDTGDGEDTGPNHGVGEFEKNVWPKIPEDAKGTQSSMEEGKPKVLTTDEGFMAITLLGQYPAKEGSASITLVAELDASSENLVLLSSASDVFRTGVDLQATVSLGTIPIEQRYSILGFLHNTSVLGANVGALVDTRRTDLRSALRLFTVQFFSYLRDTFGEEVRPAGPQEELDPASIELWANLLHIRSAFFEPQELERLRRQREPQESHLWEELMPPARGDLVPRDARPWAELLAEGLLLQAVRDAPVLKRILSAPELHERLRELGWETVEEEEDRERFADELADDLLKLGVGRRYGSRTEDVPAFWRLYGMAEPLAGEGNDPTPELRHTLDLLLTRWMLLDVLFEIRFFEDRPLDTALQRLLPELWCHTHGFCRQWLLLHRQWSTLHGADRDTAVGARGQALEWWRGGGASGGLKAKRLAVHIDPIWTNLYLLAQVLEHFAPEAEGRWTRLEGEISNEAAQRELLASVARVAAFVLWNLGLQEEAPERFCFIEKAERNESAGGGGKEPLQLVPFHQPVGAEPYAEALIRLMEAFGHHVLKVDPAVDIRGYLRRAIESEPLLHAVSDYYRDHLYHLVDLCLLGDFLLTARVDTRAGHLWRALFPPTTRSTGFFQPYRLDALRRQWFVASVFHDVGYLFTLLAAAPQHLRDQMAASHNEFVEALEAALRGALEQLEDRIADIARHLESSRPGLDRGVHSAVMLRDHLLSAIPSGAGAQHELVRTYLPALRAICQHNLPGEQVRQDTDPLSFLMVVCDELQDWARTRVQLAELKRHTVFRTADDANWQERRVPLLTELILPVSGVQDGEIVLGLETPSQVGGQPGARRRRLRIPFVQVYSPDEIGYLNPIYLWVLRAQNLQRLQRYELGDVILDLEIHTITHIPQRLRKAGLNFRGALAEVAAERGDLGLEDLVARLDRMVADAVHPLGRTACGGNPPPCSTWDGWTELQESCREHRPRTAELQVFHIESLRKAPPVRGYPREKKIAELAGAYQRFLRAREDQRLLLNLRHLDVAD